MDGEPLISPDVLARYAVDAASEVTGVSVLGQSVEVSTEKDAVDVRVNVELEWGRSAAEVGRKTQRHVCDYVERMTSKSVGTVDVVVERVAAPPA